MINNSGKTGFPGLFGDSKSSANVRQQFIDAPAEAVRQAAFAPALEIAKLIGLLPKAFSNSQQRELKRLRDSSEENDPRISYLEASIEQTEAMVTMARRGEARVKRSVIARVIGDEIFHGFVSDSELNPLEGLTVRLTAGRGKAKQLSSTTAADGYFRIPLSKRGQKVEIPEEEAANVTPEQIAELFARREAERDLTYEPADGQEVGVEILKKSQVLYEDPVPVDLGRGAVYREYVISEDEPSSLFDFEEFVSSQSYKPTSKRKATSKAAETTEAKAAPRAKPAATRGKKKAAAKSKKRKT